MKPGKAIVLDIDGVIVGEKRGYNQPHPHVDVMAKMKRLREDGIPVVLCTSKPAFSIEYEIRKANLSNPHIADGGSLLIDDKGVVVKQFPLDNELANRVVKTLIANNIYTEVYTKTDYVVQANQVCELTDKHEIVLERPPVVVDDLAKYCQENTVVKIMMIAPNENEIDYANDTIKKFGKEISSYWAVHPIILPLQFGVITASGVSKPQALKTVADVLDIPLKNFLGVGDSTSDWKFIELCGYGAAMGNASDELKRLIKTKGEKGYIGGAVDENGVIGIMDWWLGEQIKK